MTKRIHDAIKVALAVLVLLSVMLMAGWVDSAEAEEHDAWYADQATKTWCL